jgi:putative nucleotidyltransferase with HDIG domain
LRPSPAPSSRATTAPAAAPRASAPASATQPAPAAALPAPAPEPEPIENFAEIAQRAIEVASPAELAIVKHVNERLEKGDFPTPVLPDTHLRVLDIINRPNAAIQDITQCVKTDAVVATEVISLVNSAAFMPAMPIRDLNRAIVHVGIKRVRSLMLGVAMRLTVFRKADAERGKQLWNHSLATAVLAREIARAGRVDVDEAFLAGLLHDIGKTVILGIVADEERRSNGIRIPAPLLWKLLEEGHTAVGVQVARAWHLSGSLADAVSNHHRVQATSHPMVATAALADDVCRVLGVGVPPMRIKFQDHPAFESLGMTGGRGPDLVTRLPEVLAASPEFADMGIQLPEGVVAQPATVKASKATAG